jgi:hypothetical protein
MANTHLARHRLIECQSIFAKTVCRSCNSQTITVLAQLLRGLKQVFCLILRYSIFKVHAFCKGKIYVNVVF